MLALATPVLSFVIAGLQLRRVSGWDRLGNALLVASPLTLILFVTYNPRSTSPPSPPDTAEPA
jgi:hypothetical protein